MIKNVLLTARRGRALFFGTNCLYVVLGHSWASSSYSPCLEHFGSCWEGLAAWIGSSPPLPSLELSRDIEVNPGAYSESYSQQWPFLGGQARDQSATDALVVAALPEQPFRDCFYCCSWGSTVYWPPHHWGDKWVRLFHVFLNGNIKNRWHLPPLLHWNEVWYYSLFFVTSRFKSH